MNERLEFLEIHRTERYFGDNWYLFNRLVKRWRSLKCSEITRQMIQGYIDERTALSRQRAYYDMRMIKALFNFGVDNDVIDQNPAAKVKCLRPERTERYVPTIEDIKKVLAAADEDTRDYLLTFLYTMGRMSEINRLVWDDVKFDEDYVVLRTRKKRGGVLTPRKIPLGPELKRILAERYERRDPSKPWVFWHRYWSTSEKAFVEGPYQHRSMIMRTLCEKANVRYFRYHAIRHAGASTLDRLDTNLGDIQQVLGHESRKTTEIYLHPVQETMREAMTRYENFIGSTA